MQPASGFEAMLVIARDDTSEMRTGKVRSICVAATLLLCACVVTGAEKIQAMAPLVIVYASGHLPVESVSVAVTNRRRDVALLVTSVEFEGQLPELRYFYHGVYGRIEKRGDSYEHAAMMQQLSRPVGTCFLLPGQSASWKRPMRVVGGGYLARVTWREIPADSVPTSVWSPAFSQKNTGVAVYEPLSGAQQDRYANIAAGTNTLPLVVVEGEFPPVSAEVAVPCIRERGNPFRPPDDDLPEGSIEFHLEPVVESAIVTKDEVTFRKYNMGKKSYEPVAAPDISPTAIDFIFLCTRTQEKAIPCILSPEVFGDLIEVKRPFTEMYYNPGITEVPLKLFPAILERAKDRGLPVELRRIDPNSLGRQHVLVIGVKLGDSTPEQDPKG